MSLITDELVWAVRTATPCRRNALARWAENVLSSYCFCRVAARAVSRIFVCAARPGRLGRPARLPGIVTGYMPRLHVSTSQSHLPAATSHHNQLLMARTTALTAIRNVQQMLLKHALRKKGQHHFHPFIMGQKVWLEGTNLKTSHPTKKLTPKRYRPFPITDVISPVVYHLTLPPSWKIHNVFHVLLLTPYKETEEHGPNFAEPPPELIEEHEEYKVEQVLASRLFGC
jgi:hypothetical protein